MPVALEPWKVHVVWPRGGGQQTRGSGLGRAEGEKGEGPQEPPPHHHPPSPGFPSDAQVNIETSLLSWFNMCCVPTSFWSLTQTPAGLREPMEVRGQLLHWIPVEDVSTKLCWFGLTCTVGRADQELGA